MSDTAVPNKYSTLPTWLKVSMPFKLILGGVGFRPHVPVKWHGIRMDPPISLPRASGAHRDATRLASPPLLPPGVRSGFQGLSERPKIALSLSGNILPLRRERDGFSGGGGVGGHEDRKHQSIDRDSFPSDSD